MFDFEGEDRSFVESLGFAAQRERSAYAASDL